MPRKKLSTDPSPPTETATVARTSRRTKTVPAEASPDPTPVVAAKPTRTKMVAVAAEPEVPEAAPTPTAVPARTRAKKASVAEPSSEKPVRTRKAVAKELPSAPVVAPIPIEIQASEDLPMVQEFRRPTGGSRPQPASEVGFELTFRPAHELASKPEEKRGRTRRERTPRTETTVEVPAPATVVAPLAVESVVVFEPETEFDENMLPLATWRTVASGGGAIPSPVASESSDPEKERESRDKRGRRRRGSRDEKPESAEPVVSDATEAPAVAAVVVPPVPPVPVKRSIIPPDAAPRVVVRNGIPTIVRDHKVLPPLMFFGSPSDERRAQNVFDQIRMAAESGVHIFSYLIELEVSAKSVADASAFAAYMLTKSIEIDPECQVIFRVVFQAPRNWVETYPLAKFRTLDGTIAEPSVCDDGYWDVARDCLSTFVTQLRLLESSEHVLGVHLERGEWFLPHGTGYDNSAAAQLKFRDWAKTRYSRDVVTLRASWFDGDVTFDNLRVPEFEPEGTEGEKFVRSSRKQRRFVDYHLFLSDITVARITELAYAAKEASEGWFLVGASYGYTFEWSHPSSGHLALGKLLRSEDVDFIAGPPSYRNREPGGTGPFPGPIDSFALNGKLYISEEDFKTSLSTGHEPDDFNPALKTPQALESAHWRGAGAALSHGSGLAWMDIWGNGWLKSHGVWERAAKIRQALIERMEVPLGDPEVAVFIDERSLAYLVDPNAFDLLVQNVREAVLRAGVSAAFYLLSDLAHREKFPESKAYIFLNAWDIRPDLRDAIKARLHRDNKVLLWLYSAGLFDGGRDSLERVREVTGIALKPQPFYSKAGTTLLNKRHALSQAFADSQLISDSQLEPSYFAVPEGATVLGEYTQTGLPSFVVKVNDEDRNAQWTSVFLGEPLVNPALIRALAQMAGAHVWNFNDDVVHVRAPFCTIHCGETGTRNLTLPDKQVAYCLTNGAWFGLDAPHVRFTAVEGSTHSFVVGAKPDVEHLLATNEKKALIMLDLPPRDANVRVDSSNFDVPMMKLDEWMEGGEPDEIADEWFLRTVPPVEVVEQAEESADKVGRRRRRRGGRPGREDGRPSSPPEPRNVGPAIDDELGLNVMFRKRD